MKKICVIPDGIALQLTGSNTFEAMMRLQGKAFRDVPGRKTMQVELGGKSYFIKQHVGVGWTEIIKSLISLKAPIIGAMTEVNAIKQLGALGIPATPLVAYGQQGCNPARVKSFVMTEDLGEILSLEELCADWLANPPTPAVKAAIIKALAQLAAKFHRAGLCHRDFYLCHFVIKKTDLAQGAYNFHLIDLHRVLQHQSPAGKTVMKDIAGLMFSAMDSGFEPADWDLFKQYYLSQSTQFWTKVEARAQKLYQKFHSVKFQKRLAEEKSAIRS
jgi:heptose I phosphotransferase